MNKEVTIDIENPKGNDAISREDALMALTGEWTEITDEIIHRFIRRIKALPSVKPQESTGHWYRISSHDTYYDLTDFKCSKCGKEISKEGDWLYEYCPRCGTRMEVEQNG